MMLGTYCALVGALVFLRVAAADAQDVAEARVTDSSDEGLSSASGMQSQLSDEALEALGGPGMLEVNSQPWSEVFVDGKSMGNTPLVGEFLAPGVHTVEFVCTACNPQATYRESVVVESGRARSLVHRFDDGWTRTRLSQPLEPRAVPTQPSSPLDKVLVAHGDPEAELLINSKPWSRISLNGVEIGPVPIAAKVAPGEYEITFDCATCEPAQSRTEGVRVAEGQTMKLIVLFD